MIQDREEYLITLGDLLYDTSMTSEQDNLNFRDIQIYLGSLGHGSLFDSLFDVNEISAEDRILSLRYQGRVFIDYD